MKNDKTLFYDLYEKTMKLTDEELNDPNKLSIASLFGPALIIDNDLNNGFNEETLFYWDDKWVVGLDGNNIFLVDVEHSNVIIDWGSLVVWERPTYEFEATNDEKKMYREMMKRVQEEKPSFLESIKDIFNTLFE